MTIPLRVNGDFVAHGQIEISYPVTEDISNANLFKVVKKQFVLWNDQSV